MWLWCNNVTVLVKFVNISGLCECKYGEGEGNAAMRYSGSTRSLCGVYINILALKEKKIIKEEFL